MKSPVFRRKAYDELLDWKQNWSDKYAVLVKGARRVGKSTIVEEFSKREFKSYIMIDFAKAPKSVKELFDDISDLDFFFLQLQQLFKKRLYEYESVIIFDEVQLCPHARQAIKHLVADGRYNYIETGTLLSIRKNTKDILIPSEEHKITMYPLDFEEFLWAIGDDVTPTTIKHLLQEKRAAGNTMHRNLVRTFRLYMLVGGMPQAIEAYLDKNNLQVVDKVKREIIELYEEDLIKVDPSGLASDIFDAMPANLNKNAARYVLASARSGTRTKQVAELIPEIASSCVVNVAYHSNDPNVGMALEKDIERYKLFASDTGLFVTLAFKDKKFTENVIYDKLLNNSLSANLGYVFENVTAQILVAKGNNLFYYTMASETSNHLYEVDFLLSKGNKICPVEVKSGNYRTLKSLEVFCKKFTSRIGEKIVVHTKDYKRDTGITYLPIYMLPFI